MTSSSQVSDDEQRVVAVWGRWVVVVWETATWTRVGEIKMADCFHVSRTNLLSVIEVLKVYLTIFVVF